MKQFSTKEKFRILFSFPVIIAALGYFVDIYDLLLFGIVRIPSLNDMNLDADKVGTMIINYQMIGLVLGGIIWGVFGDKKGRLSVLFGSIIVYSLANIACGFLPEMNFADKGTIYAVLRFIAGIGLAGELGAGITLVSETLPKELRAIGTSIVAGFGVLGAVVAQFTVELAGSWTTAYIIGGCMGLVLLVLRISVAESGMFKSVKENTAIKRGDFFSFFTNKVLFLKYMRCVFIGIPIWYGIGILVFMANQFAPEMGIASINPGKAIMWTYTATSISDFTSGWFSQVLKSRKKAILYMLLFTLLGVILLLFSGNKSENMYYFYCAWIGFGSGFWALFVTVAAEQFGTNLRSTATTSVPNMVRGSVPIMLIGFDYLKQTNSVIYSAAFVGLIAFGLALYAVLTISETHNTDLDYVD
ncbi:MFS transporter [Flavobacterium sangjuense]|uniref:Sialic acid transporter n=1 Tax=Flavobacterium sangjuense TaxID=2518177 RepID=A0A4P7PXF3_9FLAO|nr:MFS transporter [Flavobacterium sangjuense]QBZ98972.1 Putative sialic acid transporter [Flavobacterium sangjuense]